MRRKEYIVPPIPKCPICKDIDVFTCLEVWDKHKGKYKKRVLEAFYRWRNKMVKINGY
jgi:hypothetical protein